MTAVEGVAAFLRAALIEDASAAHDASLVHGPEWSASVVDDRANVVGSKSWDQHAGEALWDDEGAWTLRTTVQAATHMARHDPSRVLDEVSAKRRILDAYEHALTLAPVLSEPAMYAVVKALEASVRLLAWPYRHRAGWQPAWAPKELS